MVDDLLKNQQLLGLSREEVQQLLGVPSGRDSIRDGKYVYWAGTDSVIDDMWLEIDFEFGSVVATRYVPD
jgi:hypothetical protein